MCNNGNGDDSDVGGAIQEQYDNTDSDSFADHWGIDTDSGTLTPTDSPEGTDTQ